MKKIAESLISANWFMIFAMICVQISIVFFARFFALNSPTITGGNPDAEMARACTAIIIAGILYFAGIFRQALD